MQLGVEGRLALVAGGASGIGRACVENLRQVGARVVVLDRDAEKLAALPAQDGPAAILCDICDDRAVREAVASLEAEHGPIDILVVAAGLLDPPRRPERLTQTAWDRVFSVNLEGVRNLCMHAGTRMARRGAGSIVTIASIAGLEAGPLLIYGPAKAAMLSLTRALAGSWGRAGVRVNAVAPGYVRTPALDPALALGFVEAQRLAQASALGRLATAREVADAVTFLASDAASALTGVVLPVDCGAMLSAGWAPHGGFPDDPEAATPPGPSDETSNP